MLLISPINSFLQRAGRCARFANETGDIYVYDILEQEEKIALETALTEEDKSEIRKINNKYLPYSKEESQNSGRPSRRAAETFGQGGSCASAAAD